MIFEIELLFFAVEIIFKDEIPYCTEEECKGIVKPGRITYCFVKVLLKSNDLDIVFFGEQLPARFNECRSEVNHRI